MYLIIYRTRYKNDCSHFEICEDKKELLQVIHPRNAKAVEKLEGTIKEVELMDIHGKVSAIVHKIEGSYTSLSC